MTDLNQISKVNWQEKSINIDNLPVILKPVKENTITWIQNTKKYII